MQEISNNESSLRFLFCFPLKFYSWSRNRTFPQKNFEGGHLRLNVALHVYLLENSVRFQGRKY